MNNCNCNNTNREYTDIKDLPTDDVQYVLGIGKDGNLKIGILPNMQGYLPLSGGAMEGPLTLVGNPQEDYQAATRKFVVDMFEELRNNLLIFKGYVSATEPYAVTQTAKSELVKITSTELWYEGTDMPTKFPVTVKVFDGKSWSGTMDYTPANSDWWSNLNNKTSWYWLGGEWHQIDFGADSFDQTQFEIVEGKLRIKQNAITDNEIAVGANIQQSKILNLGPELANLHERVAALEKAPQGDGWTYTKVSTEESGDVPIVNQGSLSISYIKSSDRLHISSNSSIAPSAYASHSIILSGRSYPVGEMSDLQGSSVINFGDTNHLYMTAVIFLDNNIWELVAYNTDIYNVSTRMIIKHRKIQ